MNNVSVFESVDSISRLQVQGEPIFDDDRLLLATPKGIVAAREQDGRWMGEETGPVVPPAEVGPNPVLQFESISELDLLLVLTKDGLSAYSLSKRTQILPPLPKTKGAHAFTVDRRKRLTPSTPPSSDSGRGTRLQVFVMSKRKVQIVGFVLQLSDATASAAPPRYPTCSSCTGTSLLAESSLRNTPHRIVPLKASDSKLWLVHLKASYRLMRLQSTPLWNAGRTEPLGIDEGITIDLPSGAEPVSCLHHDQLILAVGPTLHFTAIPTTHEEAPTQQAALQLRSKPRALCSAGTFLLAACEGAVEVILSHKTFGISRVQELFYPGVTSIAVTHSPGPLVIALFAPSGQAGSSGGAASLVRPSFSGFYSSAASSKPEVVTGTIEILTPRTAEAVTRDLESVGDFDSAMDFVPLLMDDHAQAAALLQAIRARYASRLLSKGALPEALLYLSSAFPEDPFPLLGLLDQYTGLQRHELAATASEFGFSPPLERPQAGPLAPESPEVPTALALCIPYLYSYRSRLEFRDEDSPEKAPVAALLDTSLIHVLVEAGDFEGCFRLCCQENKADFARCSALLQSKGLYAELVEFYRRRSRHTMALDLLRKLCKGDKSLEAPLEGRSLGLVGRAGAGAIADYLRNIECTLDEEGGATTASSTLRSAPPSPPSSVTKVTEVERRNLILEYSETVAAVDPPTALDLFLRLDPPLQPRRVIDHLHRCRPSLCVPFIEAIVERIGPVAHAEFDQELATLLLEGSLGESAEAQASRAKLRQLLLASLQLKLHLLVGPLAAAKGMEEEHAIVLIRSGRAADAFSLLVRGGVEDGLTKAEKWCAHFASPANRSLSPTDSGRLWTLLLEVLLRPEEAPLKSQPSTPSLQPKKEKGKEKGAGTASASPSTPPPVSRVTACDPLPQLDEAMALLHRYGHLMEPQAILSLLPDSLAFERVLPYLERLLPSLGEQRRALASRKALLRIEELRLRAEIARIEQGKVAVTPDRACSKCYKRLGLSAFTLGLNGELSHLTCSHSNGEAGVLSRTHSTTN